MMRLRNFHWFSGITRRGMRTRQGLALACAIVLAGCANTGGIVPQSKQLGAQEIDVGEAIRRTQTRANWPKDHWWLRWNDPQLDALVKAAVTGNPDIHIAQARLARAQAVAKSEGAQTLPHLDASGSFARTRFSSRAYASPPGGFTLWSNQAALDLSYELDIWGKNHAALTGALDAVQAAAANAREAQLVLETSVVRTYIQLALQSALRDVSADSLARQQTVLDIVTQRAQAGLASEFEVSQSQSPIPALEAELEQADRQILLTRHELAALAGLGPGATDALIRPRLTLDVPLALPASLPADLLGRRPDIVAWRWQVQARAQDIKLAHAAFYPNINLLAMVNLAATTFGNFLSFANHEAQGHSVGAAISLPIFDGGLREGQYGQAVASYDEAVENYNKVVLGAFQNVSDQVVSLTSLARQQAKAEASLRLARKAYALADKAYRGGLTDYLNVLNTEQTLLGAQRTLAQIRADRLDSWAQLMQALGGGLENAPDDQPSTPEAKHNDR